MEGMGTEDRSAASRKDQAPVRLRSLVVLGLLVALSVAFGLVFNSFNPQGIPTNDPQEGGDPDQGEAGEESWDSQVVATAFVHEGPVSESGFPIVDWSQVQDLVQNHNAVLVDARPDWSFEAGHLPNAVNLPFSFPTTPEYPKFAETHPKDRDLVLYCGEPSCERSSYLAEKLRDEFGYARIWLYEGGYEDYLEQTR